MKIKLESGEVLIAEWVELWHENNTVLVGAGDNVETYELNEISKIEEQV